MPAQRPEVNAGPAADVPPLLGHRYRLERMVGAGAMGRVFRAHDLQSGRRVAIKMARESLGSEPLAARRFLAEARAQSRINHPHVATVLDFGRTAGGSSYLVLEYVHGRTLTELLRDEGPLSARRTARLGMQIARGLRAAHREGVLHRDVKPGNVMVSSSSLGDRSADAVKLVDFGVAKCRDAITSSAGVSVDGMVIGSPEYMAPEQISGEPLDERADVYSLGATLFQMVAGRPPFLGRTKLEVLALQINCRTPRIAEVSPEVDCPSELERIIRKCLEKRPEDRYASMDALIADLKAFLVDSLARR